MARSTRLAAVRFALAAMIAACGSADSGASDSALEVPPSVPAESWAEPVFRSPSLISDTAAAVVTEEGLEYVGSTVLTAAADELPHLHAQVVLRNVSTDTVRTVASGCTVLLAIHASPARAATPLWFDGAVDGWRCAAGPEEVVLEPDEALTFRSERIPVHHLLLNGVPQGRRFATAVFRHPHRLVELGAGPVELRPYLDGLVTRADWLDSAEPSSTLGVRAMIRNVRSESTYVELPSCVISLQARPVSTGAAAPVWIWNAARPSKRCPPTAMRRLHLAPGETAVLEQLRVPVATVLGDSLDGGEYSFTVRLRINYAESPELPIGTRRLRAAAAAPGSRR